MAIATTLAFGFLALLSVVVLLRDIGAAGRTVTAWGLVSFWLLGATANGHPSQLLALSALALLFANLLLSARSPE